MAELIEMTFGLRIWEGPGNHVLDGAPDTSITIRNFSCTITAEPIDLPFGLWTWVGRRKHKFNRICQVAPMCPPGKAHWHHLANMTEPSACSGKSIGSAAMRSYVKFFDDLLSFLLQTE